MRMLENGELDAEVLHAMRLIEDYNKLLKHALKLGFSYNDNIVTLLHNERARWWNQIEETGELLVKEWKSGDIHVYNREDYLAGKRGTRWSGTR